LKQTNPNKIKQSFAFEMDPLQLTVTWYKITPCWRASYALGHPKQRKVKFDWCKSHCSECPTACFAA